MKKYLFLICLGFLVYSCQTPVKKPSPQEDLLKLAQNVPNITFPFKTDSLSHQKIWEPDGHLPNHPSKVDSIKRWIIGKVFENDSCYCFIYKIKLGSNQLILKTFTKSGRLINQVQLQSVSENTKVSDHASSHLKIESTLSIDKIILQTDSFFDAKGKTTKLLIVSHAKFKVFDNGIIKYLGGEEKKIL